MADKPEIMGYSYQLPLEQPAKPSQGWRVANLKKRWQRRLVLVVGAVPVLVVLLVAGAFFGMVEDVLYGYRIFKSGWKL